MATNPKLEVVEELRTRLHNAQWGELMEEDGIYSLTEQTLSDWLDEIAVREGGAAENFDPESRWS